MQRLPLRQLTHVVLQLRTRLRPLDPIFIINRYKVVEEQGVHTQPLIVGAHGHQQHLRVVLVLPLQRLQQMPPSCGPQTAARLLQRLRQTGHRHGDTHQLTLVVLHQRHHIHLEQGHILVEELLRLGVREGGESEYWGVGLVQQFEDLWSVGTPLHLFTRGLDHLQPDLLPGILRHTGISRRHLLGDVDTYLQPVHLLHEAQLLHVLGVIVQVVIGGCGASQLEVLHEHTLLVEVGHAHRTLHLVHALSLAPGLHGVQQRLRHFEVVDELNHGEPYVARLPSVVGLLVDDAYHAPYHFFPAIGHKRLHHRGALTGIPRSLKHGTHVASHVRDILLASGINHIRHIQEIVHFLFADDFYNLYFFHTSASQTGTYYPV